METRRDTAGSVLVEFAVLFPVLALLVLGGLDLGLGMLYETLLTFASEAAARCQAIGAASCATAAQTASYAASESPLPGIDASNFVVSAPSCGVQVTATYGYTPILLPAFTLQAAACYPHS